MRYRNGPKLFELEGDLVLKLVLLLTAFGCVATGHVALAAGVATVGGALVRAFSGKKQ